MGLILFFFAVINIISPEESRVLTNDPVKRQGF